MTEGEERKLIENIVEKSPAIVFRWIIEGEWPVEYVSNNVELLGYTQNDILSGKVSWPGITHPDDVPRLEQEVQDYITRDIDSWSQCYRIHTREGKYRWMRDWNLLLRDEQGTPEKIQGIAIDVTKEKEEEQEREEFQKELEQTLANLISGFKPICAKCKSIKDDTGNWLPLEQYLARRQPVEFSHGYCPECAAQEIDQLEQTQ